MHFALGIPCDPRLRSLSNKITLVDPPYSCGTCEMSFSDNSDPQD